MFRPAILLFLAVALLGCSSSNDVVGHGPFQKRKYRPGWHVDLGSRDRSGAGAQHKEVVEVMAAIPPTFDRMPLARVPARTGLPNPTPGLVMATTDKVLLRPVLRLPAFRWDPGGTERSGASRTVNEPRRWNRMALVSGAFLMLSILVVLTGGTSFLGYVMTFSVLTGIIGLLLAIKHKERGKGIAIAAIAFPVAFLALVIAALNAAW